MRRSLFFALVLLTLGAPVSRGQTIDAAKSYFDRGRASYANGELDRAIDDFSVAIMFDPAYAVAYYGRGNAKRANGDFLGAISDYSNAIQISPRFWQAYANRGAALFVQGDTDGAIADCDKAISINSRTAEATRLVNNRLPGSRLAPIFTKPINPIPSSISRPHFSPNLNA